MIEDIEELGSRIQHQPFVKMKAPAQGYISLPESESTQSVSWKIPSSPDGIANGEKRRVVV